MAVIRDNAITFCDFINPISLSILSIYSMQAWKDSNWKGPNLGPKPADLNERSFTDEQLAAGKNVIGLQAGQNKGATQAGSNLGASRKILIGK